MVIFGKIVNVFDLLNKTENNIFLRKRNFNALSSKLFENTSFKIKFFLLWGRPQVKSNKNIWYQN